MMRTTPGFQFEESRLRAHSTPRRSPSLRVNNCLEPAAAPFRAPVKRVLPKCWPEDLLKQRKCSRQGVRNKKEFQNLFARFIDFEVCYLRATRVGAGEESSILAASSDEERKAHLGERSIDSSTEDSISLLSPPLTPEPEDVAIPSGITKAQKPSSQQQPAETRQVAHESVQTCRRNRRATTRESARRADKQQAMLQARARNHHASGVNKFSVQSASQSPHTEQHDAVQLVAEISAQQPSDPDRKKTISIIDRRDLISKGDQRTSRGTIAQQPDGRGVSPPSRQSRATSYRGVCARGNLNESTLNLLADKPAEPAFSYRSRRSRRGEERMKIMPSAESSQNGTGKSQRLCTRSRCPTSTGALGRIARGLEPATGESSPAPHTEQTIHLAKRVCISCGATDSPCWRPSWDYNLGRLCNPCGLRYKKNRYHCSNKKCVAVPSKLDLLALKAECKTGVLRCMKCKHALTRT